MATSSQISTTNPETPNNTVTSIVITLQNCIKFILCTLARRICTIIVNKNLRKIHLKELRTTLHQRGYTTTQIYKGFKLAGKNAIKKTTTPAPKNHSNEKPLAYVSTYNKNNAIIFTEIFKDLELKTMIKSKKYQT